ncbi:sigma-70 family RNA polymerase sigma factor [Pseudonocardia parietis]|uniref:RNA polymerase sigma-70 factor (ECF subfamily) n=1 Tax=Pseudonocardia parietis TaxID=570936 RepID=A0ABS4W6S8_9PSEU|nr:sigma-70 family RNA polymerase sigma factor [Pseudonocardia parietis]MBP2371922.1 RNA polymerase sigma-70 factor (ECF subfamily) [Pseudonocardia parietis]
MDHRARNDENDDIAGRFAEHRPRLQALAARLLGSAVDAEDAVQDAWLRLAHADARGIDNLGGWLTTVTSRLCLDRLRARQARPESPLDADDLLRANSDDPAGDAALADSVGRALVVVLENLSPAERVALVLHDVFAIPFREIAPVLERSTEATKKLAARARDRARLGAADAPPDLAGRRAIIVRFLNAIREGDTNAMLDILAPDATRHVDPALLTPGQKATVSGAHAIVEEARSFSRPAHDAGPAFIDGDLGAAVERDGRPVLAITFVIAHNLIHSFDVIADPDHLSRLTIAPQPLP